MGIQLPVPVFLLQIACDDLENTRNGHSEKRLLCIKYLLFITIKEFRGGGGVSGRRAWEVGANDLICWAALLLRHHLQMGRSVLSLRMIYVWPTVIDGNCREHNRAEWINELKCHPLPCNKDALIWRPTNCRVSHLNIRVCWKLKQITTEWEEAHLKVEQLPGRKGKICAQ